MPMKLTVFLRQVAEGGIARRVYPLGAIRRVLIGTGERIWDWLKLVWWEKYGFLKKYSPPPATNNFCIPFPVAI